MKKSIIFKSLSLCFFILLIPISSAIEVHISNNAHINNSNDLYINSLTFNENKKKSTYVIIPGDGNKEFYAIIAGCTQYEDRRNNLPPPLWKSFPESTMKYVYNVLKDSSNWDEDGENIVLLLNKNATKQKIVDNLIDMGNKIDGDDIFLFSWTGHGTQVKDIDGDDGDGYDEAICPYDTNFEYPEYVNVITDDELDSYFSLISAEGLFLMFESCYSGGLVDVEAPQSYSFVDVDDDRRVVVMSSPPDKKSYYSITRAWPISTLYSIAFSNNSCDTNLDGWISAEEAFTFVNETYPFFENEMWLEAINKIIPLATLLVFILTNKILEIFRIKPELRLILSTLYTGFAYILYQNDEFKQSMIETYLIIYDEIMGAINNPNICDDYSGELNIIKIE